MLAGDPHAFLGRGRPDIVALFQPQEHILELYHTRIGEKQGGVIARHQ